MSILDLPGELYFLIAEHLTSPCDLNHLLLAHRGLAMFIAPVLARYASSPTYATAALFSFAASRNAQRVESHLKELRRRDPNVTTDAESIVSQGPNLVWDTMGSDHLFHATGVAQQRALHWAVINEKLAMIRYLISQGAEIDYRDPKTGGKAIDHAIRQGNAEIVKILIESGADVSVWELECGSLLHCTIFEYMRKLWKITSEQEAAYKNILVLLLEGGADVNLCDVYGHTVLHLVVSKWADVIPLFLEWGADINAQDSFGNTPLHLASYAAPTIFKNRSVDVFERLKTMGADTTLKNDWGQNPRDMFVTLPKPPHHISWQEFHDLSRKFTQYVQRISSLGSPAIGNVCCYSRCLLPRTCPQRPSQISLTRT